MSEITANSAFAALARARHLPRIGDAIDGPQLLIRDEQCAIIHLHHVGWASPKFVRCGIGESTDERGDLRIAAIRVCTHHDQIVAALLRAIP